MLKIKSSTKKHYKIKFCQEIINNNLWKLNEGAILELAKGYSENKGIFRPERSKILKLDIYKICIAYYNNIPVGCAIVGRWCPKNGYWSGINNKYLNIFVNKEYRRMGIGRQLALRACQRISLVHVGDNGDNLSRLFYEAILGSNRINIWTTK